MLHRTELAQYSTVRIRAEFPNNQGASGTGFFFRFDIDGHNVPALVTNRHVVENALFASFSVHLVDKSGGPVPGRGKSIRIAKLQDHIIYHPDESVDLALLPFAGIQEELMSFGSPGYYCYLTKDNLPPAVFSDDAGAVEDILMVGYPIGLADDFNNFPIFRRGVTATHPMRDYQGRSEFMIDCACYPGSSGSPVFFFGTGFRTTRAGRLVGTGQFLHLAGVLYAGPQFTAEGDIVVRNIPTAQVTLARSNIPANLGTVIKAQRILDFEPIIAEKLRAQLAAGLLPPSHDSSIEG